MVDVTPAKRVLPARSRRESAAKRIAAGSSPQQPSTPAASIPATPITNETKQRKRYDKRIKLVHVSTPTRSASTPTSVADELLPTKVIASRPLPVSGDKQADDISSKQYQSIADSAILAASLHRSRMQWLHAGVFKKYWTKPVRRKKQVEEPLNNPDVKSMHKLGTATVTIEPHTFDATFYVVREPSVLVPPVYKHPNQTPSKQSPSLTASTSATNINSAARAPAVSSSPSMTTPVARSVAVSIPTTPNTAAAPDPASTSTYTALAPTSAPAPAPAPAPPSARLPTPPGGAKTTDPVIQMLASRAASDNSLKELMKVVATSRATPDQLKEFQAHIDEFNAIVKRQEAEKEAKVKQITSTPTPPPPLSAALPAQTTVHRNSPLNPGSTQSPHFASYPMQPRPEPMVKHVILEFTSPPSANQAVNPDRWLFPEYVVLDTRYGGTEMTCSFFVERKGSDVLASLKDLTSEEMQAASRKWKAGIDYFQPLTMIVRATNSRTIATIAHSAKSLPDVQKYMQEVMEKKTRAPQEYLVYRLPKEKLVGSVDFVDSAVELSAEDGDLRDFYAV